MKTMYNKVTKIDINKSLMMNLEIRRKFSVTHFRILHES